MRLRCWWQLAAVLVLTLGSLWAPGDPRAAAAPIADATARSRSGQVRSLTATAAQAAGCTSPYVVRPGDSLARIARLCGTTIAALKVANALTSDLIHPGWQLAISGGSAAAAPASEAAGFQTALPPSVSGACASPYVVRRGDSLARIARLCGTTIAALKAANHLTRDLIYPDQLIRLPGAAAGQPLPKVVIVVVDGWRYEDTYGDPSHENIPHIWNELRPLGTWHSAIYNLGQTLTAPGHAAILGGAWQPIPNDGTGRPTAPTLFEYYRRATGAPASETALVFDGNPEGKAGHWAYSSAAGYGAAYAAQVYHSDGDGLDDGLVLEAALAALAQHPRLALIALPAVDEWGHSGNFARYAQAIAAADAAVGQLWQALQADPFYAAQTTLFVTNDHGRRLDDFTQHGGDSPSEQHVTLLTLGPRTPAGQEATAPRTLRDIAPTVGVLLNIPAPLAAGSVMWEVIR